MVTGSWSYGLGRRWLSHTQQQAIRRESNLQPQVGAMTDQLLLIQQERDSYQQSLLSRESHLKATIDESGL
jgi:hypothetical protein